MTNIISLVFSSFKLLHQNIISIHVVLFVKKKFYHIFLSTYGSQCAVLFVLAILETLSIPFLYFSLYVLKTTIRKRRRMCWWIMRVELNNKKNWKSTNNYWVKSEEQEQQVAKSSWRSNICSFETYMLKMFLIS